jgi:adenylate cyclase class 2
MEDQTGNLTQSENLCKKVSKVNGIEHQLMELKARVHDLNSLREKLIALKAELVGTFRQVDTYFETPMGRLKLREVEGSDRAMLVYYEREDIAGPKVSNVFILEVKKLIAFKRLLKKALKVRAIVDKVREIYRYEGTQIHLDMVKNLGPFIEFERETALDLPAVKRGRETLEKLMAKLEVSRENLEESSYSDLV